MAESGFAFKVSTSYAVLYSTVQYTYNEHLKLQYNEYMSERYSTVQYRYYSKEIQRGCVRTSNVTPVQQSSPCFNSQTTVLNLYSLKLRYCTLHSTVQYSVRTVSVRAAQLILQSKLEEENSLLVLLLPKKIAPYFFAQSKLSIFPFAGLLSQC